ncbi:MAG TPA: hypothetical protein VL494_13925 [Steroidobacteraceae bacterium]|nr:hypothetical protein [Steroidobacteraceae bacterium]
MAFAAIGSLALGGGNRSRCLTVLSDYTKQQEKSEREVARLKSELGNSQRELAHAQTPDGVKSALLELDKDPNVGGPIGAVTKAWRQLYDKTAELVVQLRSVSEERDKLRAERDGLNAVQLAYEKLVDDFNNWAQDAEPRAFGKFIAMVAACKVGPQQSPSDSPAKLGGPVDALRREVVDALREATQQTSSSEWRNGFCAAADRLERGGKADG